MKMHKLIVVISIGAVCGCQYAQVLTGEKTVCPAEEAERSETLSAYLDLCKEIAAKGKPDGWKDDWSVGSSFTTWEREASYKIVYADAKYMSFRAEEYAYNGGAHGGRVITVGTIEQATGRILMASDLIPTEKRTETLAALYDGVVKKIGGKENLQGEVKITDNCFIAQDGIHFVFNEYEVACYAAGAIEVVVKLGSAE